LWLCRLFAFRIFVSARWPHPASECSFQFFTSFSIFQADWPDFLYFSLSLMCFSLICMTRLAWFFWKYEEELRFMRL
jgi:hypothetical protein